MNKKKIINITIVTIFSIAAVFIGAYLAYNLIGSGFSEEEFIAPEESAKPVFSDSNQKIKGQHDVKLYFTKEYRTLSAEIVSYSFITDDKTDLAAFIIRKLLEEPMAPGLSQLLPSGIAFLSAFEVGDKLIIDFDFTGFELEENCVHTETLALYSIVNSLITNIDGINAVQILINGEIKDIFFEHIDISHPLVENISLIK